MFALHVVRIVSTTYKMTTIAHVTAGHPDGHTGFMIRQLEYGPMHMQAATTEIKPDTTPARRQESHICAQYKYEGKTYLVNWQAIE